MSIEDIRYAESIPKLAKFLHWVIDDPTITSEERSIGIRRAAIRIEQLLEQGESLRTTDTRGHNFLAWMVASENWDQELVDFVKRLVLEWGAEVNSRDNWGYTPLMRAALFDRDMAISLLLHLGADQTLEQVPGKNAYYFAEECQNLKALAAFTRFNQEN